MFFNDKEPMVRQLEWWWVQSLPATSLVRGARATAAVVGTAADAPANVA